MTNRALQGILLDEHVQYTLTEFCEACSIESDWVIELVEQGIIQPVGEERGEWRFPGSSLHTAMKARRLQRDLDLDLTAVALVLELLDEIELLRSRLRAIEADGF